jgi:deazaflavin-dependent oxidoreductase (nitroreductase family)
VTILQPPVARQEPHRTIHRWLGGWPVWAHLLGLGRLVGRRYAVITTIGRRTGATRRAAVMVLRDDAATGEIWVVAGDARTGWYRNACAAPATDIWLGSRRFRPDQRLLGADEIAEALVAIRREHPREALVQAAFFGWPWPATAEQFRELAGILGGFAFRPARQPVVTARPGAATGAAGPHPPSPGS